MTNHWLPDWLRGAWETPGVTDVVVNADGSVWIDRGLGMERWEPAAAAPLPAGAVRELAVRLASMAGRRLDDASPVVDARLPDGSRLHAVLPPVADGGVLMSLRVVRPNAMSLEDLIRAGTVDGETAGLLQGLVESRVSVLISGATGAGKTTLLASLLSLVDASERVVVIEEAGEIAPMHPHVVRLVERRANVDGAGAMGLGLLVREALRMRPDRVVLGECRGAEVREVMLALNSGHRGGFATVHANTLEDVPARLVALASLASMTEAAAALHAAAAFQVAVHVERVAGRRLVTGVGVMRLDAGRLEVERALSVCASGELSRGPAWDQLQALAGGDRAPETTLRLVEDVAA